MEMDFEKRDKLSIIHLPIIKKIAYEHRFRVLRIGIENYKDVFKDSAIKTILTKDETRVDPVIHSLRFLSDLFFLDIIKHIGYKGEMKATKIEYPNYDIELDSYKGSFNHTYYLPTNKIFFILITDTIKACWIEDIPKMVHTIIIPKRWSKDDYERYKIEFKNIGFKNCNYKHYNRSIKGGSSTPFMLFNKQSKYILPLGEFLENTRRIKNENTDR